MSRLGLQIAQIYIIIIRIIMDSEQRDISAHILLQAEQTVMHRLVNKEISLFSQGTCKLAKIDNPNQHTVYFLNLNSFYYTLNKDVLFAKIEYDDTVSYIFPHFDNGLSSITIIKSAPYLHNFQEILGNAATLLDYEQAIKNDVVRQKIDDHCPNIEKSPIVVADRIKQVIKETGKYLGAAFKALGGFLSRGVQSAGEYLDKKIQEPANKQGVNPQTKQKWDKLKKGTGQAIDVSKEMYNKYLSPLVETGLKYGKDAIKKIEESQDPKVKYARELAATSGEALGQAFNGLAEGTSEVTKGLGDQSRKIVSKKYGDDYVKTFLPQQNKKTEEGGDLRQNLLRKEEQASQQNNTTYPDLDEKK